MPLEAEVETCHLALFRLCPRQELLAHCCVLDAASGASLFDLRELLGKPSLISRPREGLNVRDLGLELPLRLTQFSNKGRVEEIEPGFVQLSPHNRKRLILVAGHENALALGHQISDQVRDREALPRTRRATHDNERVLLNSVHDLALRRVRRERETHLVDPSPLESRARLIRRLTQQEAERPISALPEERRRIVGYLLEVVKQVVWPASWCVRGFVLVVWCGCCLGLWVVGGSRVLWVWAVSVGVCGVGVWVVGCGADPRPGAWASWGVERIWRSVWPVVGACR